MLYLSAANARLLTAGRFLRRHLKATVGIVVVLLIGVAVYGVTRPKQEVYVTDIAMRGDLRQTVEAVGTVISEKDLALQFPTLDIVSQVFVKEGDTVRAGDRLALLRSGSLAASVASASASVQSAQAALTQVLEGSRPEDIAVVRAQVANKRASLDAVKQTLKNAEENLQTSQSQLRTLKNEAHVSLTGQIASAGSTASQYIASAKTALLAARGVFEANDVQDAVVKTLPSGYDSLQIAISGTLTDINALQAGSFVTDYQSALQALSRARGVISSTADIMNRAYDILSLLPLSEYFTNTSRETNKTTVGTQKSTVQSALSAVDTAIKTLRDASAGYDTEIAAQEAEIKTLEGTRDRAKADIATYETSLRIDEAQLALKEAPARQTDVDAAKARVRQAQADLARAAAQYNDTILRAPVDGLVTHVSVKAGEMRPSDVPSVRMLGQSPYRIELFVSEVDIPKIQLFQSGSIRLDAFRGIDFALRVNDIDSAATDKDGVPKYRVKMDFVYRHDDLKVGMTGDGLVVTGFRSSVISVPVRAVLEKEDGSHVVRILNDNGSGYTEKPVVTGMEGEGGNIEVTGVDEGDVVIVLVKN